MTRFPVTQLEIHAKTTNGDGSYQGYDRPVWVDDFELDIAPIAQMASSGISTRDVNVTFGGGNIITGARQVIVNQRRREEPLAPDVTQDEVTSLKRQLLQLERNLLTIQEKRAEFVDPRSAPPDLEEAERRTREEISRIKSRLAELKAE